jgi:hypothetical protein
MLFDFFLSLFLFTNIFSSAKQSFKPGFNPPPLLLPPTSIGVFDDDDYKFILQ